jgi:hypothetical protein
MMNGMGGIDSTLAGLMNVGILTQGSSFLATLGWMIFIPLGCRAFAMKNTHHAEMDELLIGRDLSWVEDGGVFREEHIPYRAALEKTRKHESPSKKRK